MKKWKFLFLVFVMKSFFSEKRGQKLGRVLYTGAHYTRVNTVKPFRPFKTTGGDQVRINFFLKIVVLGVN